MGQRDGLGTAEVVGQARVPIAKVSDSAGAELCDLSVNNVAALENSRFVRILADLDPRVPRLGRFIKHWASSRRINNRAEGTLSTYTLILQLAYFLQTRNVPVLPRVVDILNHEVVPRDALDREPQAAAGLNEYPRAVNSLISTPEMDDASGELRALPFLTDAGAIAKRFPQQNRESFSELVHGFFELWDGRSSAGEA